MALRRFSTSGLSGTKSSKVWDGETFPGYFESIATVIVPSGGSSSVTFSNIPSTYTHLQIRGICRSTRSDFADGINLLFNSDSGTNYSWHYLRGDGTSPGSGSGVSQSGILISYDLAAASATSGIFGGFIIDILDYTNTNKYTTTRHLAGNDRNGSGAVGLASGSWLNTSAVTTISLSPYWGSFNWVQYSHFALYGIRSA